MVALPTTVRANVCRRHWGDANGGGRAMAPSDPMVVRLVVPSVSAVRGKDAGETSFFFGTTSMAHGCHSLPEGDVEHLQHGRNLSRGPAVSPASSARVFDMVCFSEGFLFLFFQFSFFLS